jgi:sugar O-acyltransferase (sialic acid O-acetyltransferase NeuD family)
MSKTLAILGSGHLGEQIAHYAISDKHYDCVVFFDDFTEDKLRNGFPILGKTDAVLTEFSKGTFDELLIGLGYQHLNKKKELYELFNTRVPFGKIVHSSSWVDNSVSIGAGCVIYPCCSIDANVVIQENTVLNIGCTIAHDTNIGKHCFLSPRVALAGFIVIEEQCVLGINCTIIDNINIVSKTQIGGGTVIINRIDNSGLYVGNPSRFIR